MNVPRRFTRISRWTLLAAGALCVAALTTPASADWLVMTDGTRVETQGPWEERGKLVVFTDTNGNLVSLRASEIDLTASHQATTDAVAMANRPAPPPPPPQESVFKLTDADVNHLDSEDDEGSGEAAEGGTGDEAVAPDVSVIGWERDESSDDGVVVRATLENQGEDVAIGVSVAVTIYDQDGIALATTSGQLTSTGLVAGQTTEMVASFPGFFDFAAVNFDIRHRSLETRSTDEVPDVEDAFGTDTGVDEDIGG